MQNGTDQGLTFGDVWRLYQEQHFPGIERSTADTKLAVAKFFYHGLMDVPMTDMTPVFLDHFMKIKKAEVVNPRRNNFDNALKDLKALLNWYRINYDPMFVNPVLPRHKVAGIIRKKKAKEKKMNRDEVIRFFKGLPQFWRDFAETQFYLAARVSEVAGLQMGSVKFEERVIEVCNVAVWDRTRKKFDYLKDVPKNGENRFCHMNERLEEIMERRFLEAKDGCQFVFQDDGGPLNYRMIEYNYNKGLKRAGLFPRFSATHIMRHSAATISRRISGLDAAQAVTGHKDVKVLQKYASLPEDANVRAVIALGEYLQD